MKNITQVLMILLFIIGSQVKAQQEKGIAGVTNWLNNWTEFKPKQVDHGEPTQIITGNITKDKKLLKRNVYLMIGNVFVTNNAILTIEPGTVIIGDYKTKASLTIAKGSAIVANGLETDPIVFTSNRSIKRAGDWGGIIILGDAPNNKFGNGSVATYYNNLKSEDYINTNYGGENASSNSGILRHVRIEYAGKKINSNDSFSGLLLASVGEETLIEKIMISYSAGNSFEVWGGALNLYNLVSYKSNKNDFAFNFGAQIEINNSLAVRSPYVSDSNGSRSMQILSYLKEDEVDFSKKGTAVTANNLTLFNNSEDLTADIEMGLVQESVYVGYNTSLDMDKSVISGFSPAVLFEDKILVNQQNLEKIKFTSMFFNNCNGNIFVNNSPNNDDLENWYGNGIFYNVYSKSDNDETFIDVFNSRRPDFRLQINGIMATTD